MHDLTLPAAKVSRRSEQQGEDNEEHKDDPPASKAFCRTEQREEPYGHVNRTSAPSPITPLLASVTSKVTFRNPIKQRAESKK